MVVVGFRSQSELDLPEPVHEALAQYRLAEVGYLKANDGAAAAVPVHDATRSLVRALQAYPEQADGAAATICAKAAEGGTPTQRVESLSLFLEQLQDLRDVLFEKLLTTVDEVRDLFWNRIFVNTLQPCDESCDTHACVMVPVRAGSSDCNRLVSSLRMQARACILVVLKRMRELQCVSVPCGHVCASVAVSCRRCGGGVRHKP